MEDPETQLVRASPPDGEMESAVTTPMKAEKQEQEGKVDRIVSNARTLATDLMEMVELKVQLALVQVEEQVESRLSAALRRAIAAIVAALSGIFLLVAGALAVGNWLGSDALGFLIFAVILAIAAVLLRHFERVRSAASPSAGPTFEEDGSGSPAGAGGQD